MHTILHKIVIKTTGARKGMSQSRVCNSAFIIGHVIRKRERDLSFF